MTPQSLVLLLLYRHFHWNNVSSSEHPTNIQGIKTSTLLEATPMKLPSMFVAVTVYCPLSELCTFLTLRIVAVGSSTLPGISGGSLVHLISASGIPKEMLGAMIRSMPRVVCDDLRSTIGSPVKGVCVCVCVRVCACVHACIQILTIVAMIITDKQASD